MGTPVTGTLRLPLMMGGVGGKVRSSAVPSARSLPALVTWPVAGSYWNAVPHPSAVGSLPGPTPSA